MTAPGHLNNVVPGDKSRPHMRQEYELGTDRPDGIENVKSVIGHAVSALMKSGKEVSVQAILAFLKQQEAQSADGRKKLYGRAISVVEGDTD
ncbi:hypothetical protein [Pantoea agglomerans]|uniref:hypothetical protein n=1 Tax=Enterobacter agglomerans TaxID=549 RepID=UPI00211C83D3|nr:hypothetical protein [Pantoea agglomerans]